MISNVLSVIGTTMLAMACFLSLQWAGNTISKKPRLPKSDAVFQAPASTQQTSNYVRRKRPDIFYDAVVDRPIFSPTRRPLPLNEGVDIATLEPTTPPPEKEQNAPPPPLRLLGVMGTDNIRQALIQIDTNEADWMVEGTNLTGWTISEIGPNWLDLKSKNETVRIEMYQ